MLVWYDNFQRLTEKILTSGWTLEPIDEGGHGEQCGMIGLTSGYGDLVPGCPRGSM